ncbi:UNVERIFIED_CONTAM: hypothetical protein RMT77_017369 [Armadillidium vulgare]
MGNLPLERLESDLPAFPQIGIDAFGPFIVARGRTKVKLYGIIFICLASKTLHLELLASLNNSSFINSFRTFSAHRGFPTVIRSDKEINFVGAENELGDVIEHWNKNKIEKWMIQHNIE